jgi:hypothetical protein
MKLILGNMLLNFDTKKFFSKVLEIEKYISKEKGEFSLFALLQREENKTEWDLIVSSIWAYTDQSKTLDYIIDILKKELELEERSAITKIVIIEPNDPFIKNINSALEAKHNKLYINRSSFNGIMIDNGVIFTSQTLAETKSTKKVKV